MPKITIDGREIELPDGQRINAIEAAKRAGVEIPHYCYHAGLPVVGSCRMCLIETGNRDAKTGEIKMQPKLVPGCTVPATDGLVIVTANEKVRQARAMVEEDLLLRHPVDCPICDKAGECVLQDYHFRYGQASRRTDVMPFTSRKRDLGDVNLFIDRCVMCSRCVRFCAEVSGTAELMVTNRGAHEEIDVVPGFPLHNELSGNVVDLCPVGALADKDFLYQQRVWFMRRHRGVCTGCAVGCSIWIEENQDHIYRLKPRENPHVNKWWICNQGRYGYHHVHDEKRLAAPRLRKDGKTIDLNWNGLPEELKSKLSAAGRLGGVFSPFLSVEEAYLLAKLLRSIDPQAVLAMGPVPTAGEDQKFPGGFVISAEKAPNRRGVEEILGYFMHKVLSLRGLPQGNRAERVRRRVGFRRLQGAVDRGAGGAAIREDSALDRAGPVPLAAVGAGDLRVARRGLRRARGLVHEPQRPAANVEPGRASAVGREGRGLVVLADARPQGPLQFPCRVG